MNTKRIAAKTGWYMAVVIIFAVALWVPIYNRIEPRLFGIPFFYWFQFVWIIVTAVATAAAYKAKL
ncbi:MAG TPA: DUF3311 domain-containing protein [Gammaproteobacteria bacterium]|jgi:hypothetical protein|nr:DUF3311 domain-containing protein [Gammaproteobacteria bacterium]